MTLILSSSSGKRILSVCTALFHLLNFTFPSFETIIAEVAKPARGQFNVIHNDSGFKATFTPLEGMI